MAWSMCLLFTTLGVLITIHLSDGELPSGTKARVRTGILDTLRVVDGIAKFPSSEKIVKNIGRLSGMLGIAGSFLSFVLMFVPEEESAELKLMKDEFAKINTRLDEITSELDNIKDMITLENQRSAYVGEAHDIIFAHDRLQSFLDEMANVSCSTFNDCYRKRLSISELYVQDFNIKSKAYQILKGTYSRTSVFGDSLLELINTTYECDIPRVYAFASGVIRLTFKAQQVILFYNKLTGTNSSVLSSVINWNTLVYDVRKKADDIKFYCYDNIEYFIRKDVKNTIYQSSDINNAQAAVKLKKKLDEKYPWLLWTVISFMSNSAHSNAGNNLFTNNKAEGKRTLRAVAQDNGTYSSSLREKLISAIEEIAPARNFSSSEINDANLLHSIYERELGNRNIWYDLLSFVVLILVSDVQISTDTGDDYHFIGTVETPYFRKEGYYDEEHDDYDFKLFLRTKSVKIVAIFKSEEQRSQTSCNNCNYKGYCKIKPYTTATSCSCKAFYDGEHCEDYNKMSLATSFSEMLAITKKTPKLTDVYFELVDMADLVGASLDRIEDSVTEVARSLHVRFDDLNNKLSQEFEWANLVTQYSQTLTDLRYNLYKIRQLNSSEPTYEMESNMLARNLLLPESVEKWVFELNFLISGYKGNVLLEHKPLLLIIMDRHKAIACSIQYKAALDNTWRQIMILQHQAFIMWAKAKSLLNLSSDQVLKKYNETVSDQEVLMKSSTCESVSQHSKNLNCSGGFYAYPGLQLENNCKADHYLVGNHTVSCNNGSSSCHACNCSHEGSNSTECNDQTGQCICENNFYGRSCHDWECADTEDRRPCVGDCYYYITPWASSGGAKVSYLDRHNVVCPMGYALNGFRLQKRNITGSDDIRYKFVCCKLLEGICLHYHEYTTNYFVDRYSDTTKDIRGLFTNCGSIALTGFVYIKHTFSGGYVNPNTWKLAYRCCHLRPVTPENYESKLDCYEDSTIAISEDRNVYYLIYLHVNCKSNYLLHWFYVTGKDNDEVKYVYTCCKII